MNMEITEGLTVTERRNQKGENHYSRYLPSFFIDDDCFSSAIKRLGGDTYNVCVGKVGEVTIFNGYTWFSVSNVNSYDDCDMWAWKWKFTKGLKQSVPSTFTTPYPASIPGELNLTETACSGTELQQTL